MFEGNNTVYNLENVVSLESSPLKGKKICFLGSSVTLGECSEKISFVEYISRRNGSSYVKNSVSGTTLVDQGKNSYVSRLNQIDINNKFDLFVCQLSTNDASKNKKFGVIDDSDTETICGAINYIINYVRSTWNCPIVFYTNAYFNNKSYQKMVNIIKEISKLRNIYVIDMFNNEEFNKISDEERKLYMADIIHPTKAGYLKWWTPEIEKELYKIVDQTK